MSTKLLDRLDLIDRKLLYHLDLDAHQSYSRLAKQLRLGSDLIEYRVKKLERQGAIARFSALINLMTLGRNVYKTYVKLSEHGSEYTKLVSRLSGNPTIYWLAETYGGWDIIISMAAANPESYQIEFENALGKHLGALDRISVFNTYLVYRYPKKYLFSGTTAEFEYVSPKGSVEIDTLEDRLLFELSENCRQSHVELAAKLGTTPAIIKYRIEKLETLGVIVGYRLQLDYEKLGIMMFKVLLSHTGFNREAKEELQQFCRNDTNVCCLINQIGEHNLEIEVEVSDYQAFNNFVDKLRAKFDRKLNALNYMLLRKDHLHRYPRYYF